MTEPTAEDRLRWATYGVSAGYAKWSENVPGRTVENKEAYFTLFSILEAEHNRTKSDPDHHRMELLFQALWNVLKAGGALNDEVIPNGPELLLAAEDYVEHSQRKRNRVKELEDRVKLLETELVEEGYDLP